MQNTLSCPMLRVQVQHLTHVPRESATPLQTSWPHKLVSLQWGYCWHWTQQLELTWFCTGSPGSCPEAGSGMGLAGARECSTSPLSQPAPPAQAGCARQHPVYLPSWCPSPAARGPGLLPAAGRAWPEPGWAVLLSSSPWSGCGQERLHSLYSPHCWQHSCPRQLYATGYTRTRITCARLR